MKYVYITAGVLVFLLLLWTIGLCFYRWRARCMVRKRTDEEKCRDLNSVIQPFGFQYDICQDIFYSTKHAWQREVGYSRFYDEHAISMSMVFHCEPIYFTCYNKSYLLELWKGQYGMAAGGEIGLYVSDEVDTDHPERLFYHSVSDEEMLSMRFVLRKRRCILAIRDDIHWWLTGFVLGECVCPWELRMEACVSFRDEQMQNAFYQALLRVGYPKDAVCVNGSSVCFCFGCPYTKQPCHFFLKVRFIQWRNQRRCRKFQHVTRCFVRTLDKLDYLAMCFPRLYRMLVGMSRIPVKGCPKRGRI
ncbi:MAG: DUF4474 domain-containing protein [Lachnospiraceae bacterium]|nr:DUF4474 domain-containing protein [Lachnospiraceae bacterium]